MNLQNEPRYWVVIPAAGIGKRMGGETPKQYVKLKNKPIIEHAVSVFIKHPKIFQVVVVLHADDTQWSSFPVSESEKIITTVGAETRAASVMQGLERLQETAFSNDWVLVHDAARPCLTTETLDRLIGSLKNHLVGGLLAIPVADTLKKVDGDHAVQETVSRKKLWAAQTPQLFRFGVLYDAMKKALAQDVCITDESSAIEFSGEHPLVIRGDPRNIKITRPEDLEIAEHYLENQKCA